MAGNDEVYTPLWAAKDMVEYFKPEGNILDPCKGEGVFSDIMTDCDWCEINQGRDFFDYNKQVDWIISNPPYSALNKFTRHAMDISDNVVWLIPIWKIYQAFGLVKTISDWGGIKEHRWYGTGSKLGFPMGNAIGAIWLQKGYEGKTLNSFYEGEYK